METYKQIECREVIVSKLTTRGKGTKDDLMRTITQVFDKDGTLIAEYDPEIKYSLNDIVEIISNGLKANLTTDKDSICDYIKNRYKNSL